VVAMMKRSLDVAAETGVDLRGVLTWAFTFPGTPYFAGYRVLATNGIHLPVLNAFKLLGSLSGQRLPVESSGAIPIEELLASGVRGPPDVDALAAVDGERLQILAWNYHDDLVAAEPAPVTLNVVVPPAFGAHVAITHTRVDESHGDAHAVWMAQGSPATPSDAQLARLRNAMEPVVLERERIVRVTNGVARFSFELPRFGISLVTLTPSDGKQPATPPPNDAGCSCKLNPRVPTPPLALLALILGIALARRRHLKRETAV
jgi:xylan 1,4-beta-xylosidase